MVMTAFVLSGCGGESGSPVTDITGRWTGTVEKDQSKKNNCVPLSHPALDLSGREYIFDLEPLDAQKRKVVTDQNGARYEQYYPQGIKDGEFSVNAMGQDFNVQIPTAPTALYFQPNDGRSAIVEVYVTYNRFCTTYFVGTFRRQPAE